MRSRNYWSQLKNYGKLSFKNLLLQKFIMPRGKMRWVGHFLLAVGCLISFGVTFGLTFGWMHFTLVPGTTDMYETHFMGFTVMEFKLGTTKTDPTPMKPTKPSLSKPTGGIKDATDKGALPPH